MNPLRSLVVTSLLVALSACGSGDNGDPALRNPADFTSQSDALTVCAAGATTPGIDVSVWQGTINWSAVAGGGYKFAFIRYSDGSYLDSKFDANWAGAKNAGLLRGAYQFFEPGQSASAQATAIGNKVGRLGPGDLPVMMDVETATPTAAELDTWLTTVQNLTGKQPVIYTSMGLWNRWFPNGGFGGYGLVAANWGASCPSLAAGWSNWVFWQHSDNSSIPGISGNVDGDYFNGSLDALQGYAGGSADQAPRGFLDTATCDGITGWAQDQDSPGTPIHVDLYFGGAAGSGVPATRLTADVSRSDLCSAIGSCDHGFSADAPRSLMDGAAHAIHAYGIDANGSANSELSNSPRDLTCAPTESGVRRHVVNPTSYTAWGFSSVQDVRPISDATFQGYTVGTDLPAAPQLIQGAGDAAVYLVDGAFKRHVVSPTSMGEWHFSFASIQQVPMAQVTAMPTGPDVRQRPQLIKGSGSEIDVLDDPLPSLGSSSSTSGSSSTTGTDSAGTTSGTSSTTGTDSAGSTTGTDSAGMTSGTSSTTGTDTAGATSASASSSTTGGSAAAAGSSTGGSSKPKGGCESVDGGFGWMALLAVIGLGARRRRS